MSQKFLNVGIGKSLVASRIIPVVFMPDKSSSQDYWKVWTNNRMAWSEL
jgi:hypothetical protein